MSRGSIAWLGLVLTVAACSDDTSTGADAVASDAQGEGPDSDTGVDSSASDADGLDGRLAEVDATAADVDRRDSPFQEIAEEPIGDITVEAGDVAQDSAIEANVDLADCTGDPVPRATGADFFNLRLNEPNPYALTFDGPVVLNPGSIALLATNGGAGLSSDLVVAPTGPAEEYSVTVAGIASWANGDEYLMTVPAALASHICGRSLAADHVVEVSAVDCSNNLPPGLLNPVDDSLLPGGANYRVTFDERMFGVEATHFTLTQTAGSGSGQIDSVAQLDRRGYDLALSGLADGDLYTLFVSDGPTDSCGDTVPGSPALVTSLRVQAPGTGETCDNPIVLSDGTATYGFTAVGLDHLTVGLLFDADCISASVLSGPDIVFVYEATFTGQLAVDVDAVSDFTGGLFRVAAVLTDDPCGAPVLDTAGGCRSNNSETPSVTVSLSVVSGRTYYLYVAKTDSSPNTFRNNEVTVRVRDDSCL